MRGTRADQSSTYHGREAQDEGYGIQRATDDADDHGVQKELVGAGVGAFGGSCNNRNSRRHLESIVCVCVCERERERLNLSLQYYAPCHNVSITIHL